MRFSTINTGRFHWNRPRIIGYPSADRRQWIAARNRSGGDSQILIGWAKSGRLHWRNGVQCWMQTGLHGRVIIRNSFEILWDPPPLSGIIVPSNFPFLRFLSKIMGDLKNISKDLLHLDVESERPGEGFRIVSGWFQDGFRSDSRQTPISTRFRK